MNRYEEILVHLVSARVVAGHGAEAAVDNEATRRAAARLEAHFQTREIEQVWADKQAAL